MFPLSLSAFCALFPPRSSPALPPPPFTPSLPLTLTSTSSHSTFPPHSITHWPTLPTISAPPGQSSLLSVPSRLVPSPVLALT
ncbi:hypothetical protein E2C01_067617 [Portunus trituberculatus]|uniref:Uncharacterized protein n=1 Tax=Portunus trituberculatus TaxID=210409 RepID=A0A5B7HXX7_PORTR|nr:hypothetical protein [Portunus trituberculatus]